VQLGLGQPTPPDLVGEAQRPVRLRCRQGDQAVAAPFFRTYAGSGLVIQCLARWIADAQAQQRLADGFARDQTRSEALGETDLGRQIQRPQTGGMAKVAWAAMQERPQLLGALAREGPWRRLVRT
jgi:hypothetical protein